MKRLALTSCLALSLALSPVASSPARAIEGEEVIGLVLGLAALVAIQNQIGDRDREPERRTTRARVPERGRYLPPRRFQPRYYALPGACLDDIRTVRGDRYVLSERCLKERDVRVSGLPRSCRFGIRTRHGTRYAYSAQCLRHAGYVIGAGARHRKR